MSTPEYSAKTIYGVDNWGAGFFNISQDGFATVATPESLKSFKLATIVDEAKKLGMHCPMLLRFPEIIQHRVQSLANAFTHAMHEENYQGQYQSIYPIKVNQQRHVVEAILTTPDAAVGLEAGSKPELMAIIAASESHKTTLVCNGYKDKEYLKLALIASEMGHDVYIIIERFKELPELIQLAKEMQVTPTIGVRVRLSSIAHGKWQNTGGEKSKFGLSAKEILEGIDLLKEANLLAQLKLLHFHMGSQIANIRDIQKGLREGTRFFAALHQLGAKINIVDVGGGLGIDYEGTKSRHDCSINYTVDEYALNIVRQFKDICREHQIETPSIFTEAGRAMVAHHAVLVTDTIDIEPAKGTKPPESFSDSSHPMLAVLKTVFNKETLTDPIEEFHAVVDAYQELQQLFTHGQIDLIEKAEAEELYFANLNLIRQNLKPHIRAHRELNDELSAKLSHKYFCNFSIFQSIPDVWAIGQIFPIMPVSNLDKPIDQRVIIQDLTCDSDGRIDRYVDNQNVECTMPMPHHEPNQPNTIGIFLTGAYQEILGDCHNLFGDTDSVNVTFNKAFDKFYLNDVYEGQTRDEVLSTVNFEQKSLIRAYQQKLNRTELSATKRKQYLETLISGLKGNTYFTVEG